MVADGRGGVMLGRTLPGVPGPSGWHVAIPVALAAFVAEQIHNTVVTTTTTATCGTKSGISSTLTFTATAGTLTVTTPTNDGPPMTVTAGTPWTVSGIGVFTAVDKEAQSGRPVPARDSWGLGPSVLNLTAAR